MQKNLAKDEALPVALENIGISDFSKARKSRQSVAQMEQFNDDASPWYLVRFGKLKKLAKLGIDVELRGAFGETLLHAAFLFRQGDIVKYIVANHKELIDVPYDDPQYAGEVALHMAVANRDLSLLKVLCRYGADINTPRATGTFFQKDNGSVHYGEHVIAFAVCTGQHEMVQYLHDRGADLTVRDCHGETLWHLATLYELPDMFDLLVDLWKEDGGVIDNVMSFQNGSKMTVLQASAFHGKFNMFTHLMETTAVIGWEWGDYVYKCYPLSQLEDKRYDFPVLQSIISEGHADFQVHPVINHMLKSKWYAFAKRYFLIWMFLQCSWTGFTSYLLLSWNIPYSITDDYYQSLSLSFYIQVGAIMLHILIVLGIEIMEIMSLTKLKGLREGINIYFDLNHAPDSKSFSMIRYFKIMSWMHALLEMGLFVCIYFAHGKWARFVSAFVVVVDWILLLRFCIGFHNSGLLVISIAGICVGDVGRFSVLWGSVLIGFGVAATILKTSTNDTTYDIFNSLLDQIYTMVEMTFGMGGSIIEFEFADEYIKWLFLGLHAIFLMLSVVLILNLLIAVMTETHIMYEKRREVEWLHQWATLILLIERRICSCFHVPTGILGSNINIGGDEKSQERFACFTCNKQFSSAVQRKLLADTTPNDI